MIKYGSAANLTERTARFETKMSFSSIRRDETLRYDRVKRWLIGETILEILEEIMMLKIVQKVRLACID